MKNKGFTLIEVLVAIAIIGILAAIILVSLSISRDNANRKSAYAMARSVQAAINMCLVNDAKVLYCYGTAGTHASSSDCGGGSFSYPVINTSICGTVNVTTGHIALDWPDVSQYGYAYGAYAGSQLSAGKFAFTIYKAGNNTVFCCSQSGCAEITDAGSPKGGPCRTSVVISED